jgi:glycosyltransferase involved in cell wall biosynthesis
MNMPRVSIGLTVYNGEEFLNETVDSFLTQSFADFELIISDNASTDRTQEIARAYTGKDERVRYYRSERNLGLAWNHNRVIALARGQYFKWAAADDVCRSDYLRRCVEVLDQDSTVVLAYPKTQFVDSAGMPLDIHDPGWDLQSTDAHERLRYVIFAEHWANAVVGLIRSCALRKTRLLPGYHGGDYRVLGELSLLGRFYEIPEYLFQRRLHPNALSQHRAVGVNRDANWLAQYWKGDGASLSLPFWSLSFDRFRTIVGSQLPVRQKLSLVRCLFRHVRWRRQRLWKELLAAAATSLSSRAPSRSA